jgi:PhzF family phenazine biosynthesis protein
MKIPLFYVDAFTSEVFKGNPAAVCMLESWLPQEVLQSIAFEHNLSETAFIVKNEKELFHLKWFTPRIEVELCGHATLAAAHVIYNIFDFGNKPIKFNTLSGILPVMKNADKSLTLDFPAHSIEKYSLPENIQNALGIKAQNAFKSIYTMIVLDNEQQIINIMPDYQALRKADNGGIIVTAPGSASDYVYRFFAPFAGIDEDPVTGSANSMLIPYWTKRLDKKSVYARQLSERTGELWGKLSGNRVLISGFAVTYMQGNINITIAPPDVLVPFDFK